MKKILFIIFSLSIFACSSSTTKSEWQVKDNTKIEFTSLSIDTLTLDSIQTSCVGDIGIEGDSIYFVDKKFCWTFIFDKNGKIQNRYLGKGNGPSEISTGLIDGFTNMQNGNYFFLGAMNDCHVFSSKFERINTYFIDKGNKKKKDLCLSDPVIYTMMYEKLIFRESNGYLYYNQFCYCGEYNFYDDDEYYLDAKLISRMNAKTGKVDKMYSSYPKCYSEKTLNQFSLFSFDFDKKGNSYFCFEADSTIYKYDNKHKPLIAFGSAGSEMNTDYKSLKSADAFKKHYMTERKEKSYYNWIEYIDELGLLFRSYKKSEDASNDGLQIYRENCLIADINVPKGFIVKGYIKPYIYSNVDINEETESMKIYRLKLPANADKRN